MLILLLFCLSSLVSGYSFSCPPRCQCYDDIEDKSQARHLICKWGQLNSTNLATLGRPDLVRTLTIRCPHFGRHTSAPLPAIFHGLQNLDRLEIDRCVITHLPSGLFAGLHQLYSLIIKNARIPELPKEMFAHVPNLMTLDLSGNQLRLEPYALRSLSNLIHLDLSNNSISFLANTMLSLTKLKVLTMDNNKLSNIDFRRLPEGLTDLSLRHNSINTIHFVPNSARHLRRLDLAGNFMDFISSSGSVNVLPPSLKSLDISHNRISYIQEGTVAHLNKLTVLDLRNNSLTGLKEQSVTGSTAKLRMFVAQNPLICQCSIRWLLHPSEKSSPSVVDLERVYCQHLTRPKQSIPITAADTQNMLLCKYNTVCPDECACCEQKDCECRSNCPTGCQCYRSADLHRNKTLQNVVMCDGIRFDKISQMPSTLTELHLSSVDWNQFTLDRWTKLRTLAVTGTMMTRAEANLLSSLPSLVEVDLSSNRISTIPVLPTVTIMRLAGNPLQDPTSEDLDLLDNVAKVTMGGNFTQYICDCEKPSPLQTWLTKPKNIDKLEDLDDVVCTLTGYGQIEITLTFPGNGSLCAPPNEQVESWKEFGKKLEANEEKKDTTLTTFSTSKETGVSSYESGTSELFSDATEMTKLYTTTVKSTKTTRILSTSATTVRQRKKYDKDESSESMFINALIVVLLFCIVILAVAIGSTVYYRFEQAQDGQLEKQAPEGEPLNGSE